MVEIANGKMTLQGRVEKIRVQLVVDANPTADLNKKSYGILIIDPGCHLEGLGIWYN